MGSDFEIDLGAPEPVEGGERCVAIARTPEDLRYVEGHFPGHPIVPGVAQLLPLVYRQVRRAWPDLPAASAIRRLKFLEALRPGDVLEVSMVRSDTKVRFEIKRGELTCSHGVLVFRCAS